MNTSYARYTTFTVGNATTYYRLLVSGYSGTAGDSQGLSYSSGGRFTTKDRDNDGVSNFHCAVYQGSPWWHRFCTNVNLNGKYYHVQTSIGDSIFWYQWRRHTSL